jgi:transcription elongation factor GreA-like protein
MQKFQNPFEADEVRELLLQNGNTFDDHQKVYAANLMKKLQNLSEQFKHLSENDKAKFSEQMSSQFSESLGNLKDAVHVEKSYLVLHQHSDGGLVLPICFGILIVFVIGQC